MYYFIVLQCRIPCSVEFSMQKFQYKVVFLNLILFVRSICNHRDRIYSYKLPTTTYRQKKTLKRNFDSYPYVFFTFVYFPIFFINRCTKPQQCDRHVSPPVYILFLSLLILRVHTDTILETECCNYINIYINYLFLNYVIKFGFKT